MHYDVLDLVECLQYKLRLLQTLNIKLHVGCCSSLNLLFLWVFNVWMFARVGETRPTVLHPNTHKKNKTNWDITLNLLFLRELLLLPAFPDLSSSLALIFAVKPFQRERDITAERRSGFLQSRTDSNLPLYTSYTAVKGKTSRLDSTRVSAGLLHCRFLYKLKTHQEHKQGSL